ncbi:hypothetical protein [Coxiella burnetii]|uniref:Secreted protein n=2 Tax=Coxiella burnetii TaxID=777 RepID=Q83CE6_COXBU|nr:hypothetical protein [Coxiella burnetii]NP_820169.1 hypothetical protein CBU_1173 [Coxiella burnetii RSA 493]AAO90683.1 hypothetical protein CBU_1173 [Coxiella burnetii RSA 493]ABS76879.1 hypothetical protein CBUD_1266 [Coxiella burnetii Dugway 5J108-111]ABX77993.1 hypothetical protein COXBURSA331_A1324 [Coxiella burnetii RSA 331]ARI65974.1 hypothetical protein B7L74_06035 [Coxiella burnetii]ARK27435.1 hypothetical protein BMW92_05860 [Coxiella burnetii]
MKKHFRLILILLLNISLGAAYADKLTKEVCWHQLWRPDGAYWSYFAPGKSDPTVECLAMGEKQCTIQIGSDNPGASAPFYGGVNQPKGGWQVYKVYQSLDALFSDVNQGELKKAYNKCKNKK